ncbi:MAG TPA: hypothetical protein VI413_02240 [Paludibacter sp.]
MKTKIVILLLSAFAILNTVKASDPVYLEVISNPSKSVNYTVGIYPSKLSNNEAGDRTFLTMYLINDGTSDLVWTRMNHILAVLKNNTLVRNYNTENDSDAYSCAYIVPLAKGFHEQILCFEGKFTANDIANIYLQENDEIYQLDYSSGE